MIEKETNNIQGRFISLDILSSHMYLLRWEKPEDFLYTAGQFVTIFITDSEGKNHPRHYSLSSHPSQSELQCIIKFPENSLAKKYFDSLQTGDLLSFVGPSGRFVYQESSRNKVFLATGSGIGPLHAMFQEHMFLQKTEKVSLYFGVREKDNLCYYDEYIKLHNDGKIHYYGCLSREEGDEAKRLYSGRITQVFAETFTDFQNADFYICGIPEMVKEIILFLRSKSVDPKNVHFELFTEAKK